MAEPILDVTTGKPFVSDAMVNRASDPVVPNASTPADFAAQYPTPLDTTEILALCEEVSVLQAIPEVRTGLKQETWREMTSLAFTSGTNYVFFADGACPEEYTHNGDNVTVSLKNIGTKKSLTISDIMHSAAVASAGWNGINALVGAASGSEGMPGGQSIGTFVREAVADLKEKEVRLAMTLVMNEWDRMLINGSTSTSALQFDGIVNWQTAMSCSFHTSPASAASGTFSASSFDQWLSEGCAKPTHIFGHPAAIQEMMSAYFQLGFQGSQVVNVANGNRITPGFNFGGFVNTGIGTLQVVADTNFPRTASGSASFQSTLYALRMTHNGERLVYRSTQIPLSLVDLNPGCTAISFEVWAKTALIIKQCCAHGAYTALFNGRVVTTCPVIG